MLDTSITQLPPDVMRTFIAAAETGSFTAAGKRIHRTQSAVSMQMKRLESDVGNPLFQREGRGVVLTVTGETLYQYARRLISLHDEAVSAVSTPHVKGMVRLGAPEDYAAQFLPPALKRFGALHPAVQVEVLCHDTPTLRDLFDRGALDIVLKTEENGQAGQLYPLDLTWIVAENGGPLNKGGQVETPLPLALFHAGCNYRRNALHSLDQAGIPYRVAFGSPSLAGVLAAVQSGLAVAPVARFSHTPGCRRATLREGLPPIAPASISLTISNSGSDPAIASFHEFIDHEMERTTT